VAAVQSDGFDTAPVARFIEQIAIWEAAMSPLSFEANETTVLQNGAASDEIIRSTHLVFALDGERFRLDQEVVSGGMRALSAAAWDGSIMFSFDKTHFEGDPDRPMGGRLGATESDVLRDHLFAHVMGLRNANASVLTEAGQVRMSATNSEFFRYLLAEGRRLDAIEIVLPPYQLLMLRWWWNDDYFHFYCTSPELDGMILMMGGVDLKRPMDNWSSKVTDVVRLGNRFVPARIVREGTWEDGTRIATLELERLDMSRPSPELFRIEFPTGTRVFNEIERLAYTVGVGGEREYFEAYDSTTGQVLGEHLAASGVTAAAPTGAGRGRLQTSTNGFWTTSRVVLLALAMALGLAAILWRRLPFSAKSAQP
jgi:hypothetical protein